MRSLIVVSLALASSFTGGCGGVWYSVEVNAATSRLETARQMGAEHKSPYEYYFAKEHLRQAQLEAAEASYSDAATYAEVAELYAQKAIDQIQAAKKGETK